MSHPYASLRNSNLLKGTWLVKFVMGADTLAQLTKKTSSSSDDMGALVKQLAQAAAPLEGKFNGAGRSAFDRFKAETDHISIELNAALAAVLAGIAGMDRSYKEGDSSMADETRSTESSVSFDAARFSSSR
ncbi:hypothetical protein SAMN04489834_0678 [Microterricola viridarii]|uniref:WXG100 family type VII secretion target n=2 Tax=Microterricola viridarii TaxID=412690 RepID=A0A1H1NMT2_9MICO|nr:hypothetical protein SAMN04489834_0678 [Microterricola viridarii]